MGDAATIHSPVLLTILSQQQAKNAPNASDPGSQAAIKFSLQDLSAAIETCSPQPVLLAEQPEIRQERELWVGCRNTCAKHTHRHWCIFPHITLKNQTKAKEHKQTNRPPQKKQPTNQPKNKLTNKNQTTDQTTLKKHQKRKEKTSNKTKRKTPTTLF